MCAAEREHGRSFGGAPAASDAFIARRTLTDAKLGDFIIKLVPQARSRSSDVRVNVAFGHSLLPDIHNDLAVLVALSECSESARHCVFKTPGLEAIVAHHWCKARFFTYFTIVWQVIMLLNFLVLAYSLRKTVTVSMDEYPQIGTPSTWALSIFIAGGLQFAGLANQRNFGEDECNMHSE